jgi:hypothetical protein
VSNYLVLFDYQINELPQLFDIPWAFLVEALMNFPQLFDIPWALLVGGLMNQVD